MSLAEMWVSRNSDALEQGSAPRMRRVTEMVH